MRQTQQRKNNREECHAAKNKFCSLGQVPPVSVTIQQSIPKKRTRFLFPAHHREGKLAMQLIPIGKDQPFLQARVEPSAGESDSRIDSPFQGWVASVAPSGEGDTEIAIGLVVTTAAASRSVPFRSNSTTFSIISSSEVFG